MTGTTNVHAPLPHRTLPRRRVCGLRIQRPGRQAHGLHDHRQFDRGAGRFPSPSAGEGLPVRRAGRAWPARLARVRVPAAGQVRHARDLRAFQRERLLLRPAPDRRAPAGRGNGARLVQRFVPGPVLPAEGGLHVRLRDAEWRTHAEHVGRDRADPGQRRAGELRSGAGRAHAGRRACRKQSRCDAPRVRERAGDLRLLVGRTAGRNRRPAPESLPASVVLRTTSAADARITGCLRISLRTRCRWRPACATTSRAPRTAHRCAASRTTA